jgi:hypothetical protein
MNEGVIGSATRTPEAPVEDKDLKAIKRKTMAVKADKVNDLIMNLNAAEITESVSTFQQM